MIFMIRILINKFKFFGLIGFATVFGMQSKAQLNCGDVLNSIPHPPISSGTKIRVEFLNPNSGSSQYPPYKNKFADLTPLNQYNYSVIKFDAERYYPNLISKLPSAISLILIGLHRIEIVIPKNSDYVSSADRLIETIIKLPFNKIEALNTVRINTKENRDDHLWREKYKNFTGSAASAMGGELDIFPIVLDEFINRTNEALRITRHEFGHLIASEIFGLTTPTNQYIEKAQQDPYSVSEYGKNSWAEDFAEGIELYIRTNAAILNQDLRNNLLNRFNFFDDIFNYRVPQSLQTNLQQTKRKPIEVVVSVLGNNQILAIAPTTGIGILLQLNK